MKTSQNIQGRLYGRRPDYRLMKLHCCAANDNGTTIFREGLLKINGNVPDSGLRLWDMQ